MSRCRVMHTSVWGSHNFEVIISLSSGDDICAGYATIKKTLSCTILDMPFVLIMLPVIFCCVSP